MTTNATAGGARITAGRAPRTYLLELIVNPTDPTLLDELQKHLAEHTPSCNARTDHLMRRAAWALGLPRPAHVGGNAEDCPGCEGTNPPYPFICPGPDAAPIVAAPSTAFEWIDGDPLMEAIAAAVWEHCEQHDSGLIVDDPRNIAAVAATVARSAVRAETLRDAEEICDEAGAVYTSKALNEEATGAYELMERFRRKAEEAEQTAVEAHDTGTQQPECSPACGEQHTYSPGCALAGVQQQPDRPFRDEPTEVLRHALALASVHASQAARFRPQDQDGALPAVADLFRTELQHREEQTPADEETLVHVGWWCWRGDNHGHLATMACRSDNVPIHVPAEWADEMRAVIQRIEDGDDEPAPVAQQPAAEPRLKACTCGPDEACGDPCDYDAAEQQPAADGGEKTPLPQRDCSCSHPADEHSVYGCVDGCDCEWMPRRSIPRP